MPKWPIAAFAILALAAGAAQAAAEAPAGARRAELVHLVRQDCGSCHGLTLKGGLGPALLPETLAAHTPESLAGVIRHGLAGTAMPPFAPFLTEPEALWIGEQLLKGFPEP